MTYGEGHDDTITAEADILRVCSGVHLLAALLLHGEAITFPFDRLHVDAFIRDAQDAAMRLAPHYRA